MPAWKPPKNIAKTLGEGNGIWEDERWSPILPTIMSDTELAGRSIPVAWQIEFDPFAAGLEAANARLKDGGHEPDGYGWGECILIAVQRLDAALAKRLHLADCESNTCVVWVESAEDCRVVIQLTWNLLHGA
jgi:hypothetical protein